MRHTGRVLAMLVAVAALALASAAHGATATFDFSTATVYTNLPQNYTSGGVTGTFTGPFSIQNAGTTFLVLSQFSDNYLYPNTTPVTLYDNLKGLIENPTLRVSIGEKGREYVEKHHDSKIIARQHLDLYQSLINGEFN